MYIRRKVFSIGESNIYQQLYSEAFEDGINYAIEKMFSKNPAKKIAKNQKKKRK